MASATAWPRPAAIWLYYERAKVALITLRNETVVDSVTAAAGPFLGLTAIEYEAALSDMRNELDTQVTLALVASLEASFRIDFEQRWRKRLKDNASREFRKLAQQYGTRVRFEDILDVWKKHTGGAQIFGRLAQLLNYHDWLAHGRYWVHKTGREFDPSDAWQIGQAVEARLPGEFPLQ